MPQLDQSSDARSRLEQLYLLSPSPQPQPLPPAAPAAVPGGQKSGSEESLARLIASTVLIACAWSSLNQLSGNSEMLTALFKPPATSQMAVSVPPAAVPASALSMQTSEITGILDPSTLSASYYWTFKVHNNSPADQEAQMRLRLPHGAAVTRATLWINGVPQEAAFSSTSAVQHAYHWITVQHRDPLLVIQTAPDEITLKAAPVPAGSEMQFRIGITAPASLQPNGRARFDMPALTGGNVQQAQAPKLHLQSNLPIDQPALASATVERNGTSSLLRVTDGKPGEEAPISVLRANSAAEFAVRATHAPANSWIVANARPNAAPEYRLVHGQRPAPFVNDEAAAHRVSTLWAKQQIERLAALGQTDQAVDYANAYRVVSSVSGATVLEMQSDYDINGLNRDMQRTISHQRAMHPQPRVAPPAAAPLNDEFAAASGEFVSSASMPVAAPQGVAIGAMAPVLQGATNSTIGPQGSDATVISGVNTAGTVRVNNLANLEAGLNIAAIAAEIAGIVFGAWYLLRAALSSRLQNLTSSQKSTRYLVGSAILAAGLTAPEVINWLVASARDANLFS